MYRSRVTIVLTLKQRTLSAQYEGRQYRTFTVNVCGTPIQFHYNNEHSKLTSYQDLLLDDRCKDLPYVNGTLATYRFYAGTPITTERNINIGTLFVFSDQPRLEGLTAFQHRCKKSSKYYCYPRSPNSSSRFDTFCQ